MGKEEKVSIIAIGLFGNVSVKKNKSVDISFKFSYDERINIIQCVAFISQNISIYVKKGKEKAKQLGVFRLQALNMDRDGETTLKFNSELEQVNMDEISNMLENVEELLKIKLDAIIEIEEEETENE